MKKIYKISGCSPQQCAPAICKCPEITIEEGVDGDKKLLITDDFGGVCCMAPGQFYELAKQFIVDYDNGL